MRIKKRLQAFSSLERMVPSQSIQWSSISNGKLVKTKVPSWSVMSFGTSTLIFCTATIANLQSLLNLRVMLLIIELPYWVHPFPSVRISTAFIVGIELQTLGPLSARYAQGQRGPFPGENSFGTEGDA